MCVGYGFLVFADEVKNFEFSQHLRKIFKKYRNGLAG